MISHIFNKPDNTEVCLAFDCLNPDEAHKILDVLFQEDMVETLSLCETELSYDVTGYRYEGGKKRWSHDLVIFVSISELLVNKLELEKQLENDREFLERIRDIVIDITGIQEES